MCTAVSCVLQRRVYLHLEPRLMYHTGASEANRVRDRATCRLFDAAQHRHPKGVPCTRGHDSIADEYTLAVLQELRMDCGLGAEEPVVLGDKVIERFFAFKICIRIDPPELVQQCVPGKVCLQEEHQVYNKLHTTLMPEGPKKRALDHLTRAHSELWSGHCPCITRQADLPNREVDALPRPMLRLGSDP